MTTPENHQFESDIASFLEHFQDLASVKVLASQIWSLDAQGFHKIWNETPQGVDFREVARQVCLQNCITVDGQVAAIPFRLNEKQSGALVLQLDNESKPVATEMFDSVMEQQLERLDSILTAERLTRLSGSSARADWLGKALSLAYELEHATNPEVLYRQIHETLQKIMYAKNFFVVTLDESETQLQFEYIKDEFDDNDPIPIHEGVLQGSLSAYVVKSKKIIRGPTDELTKEVMGYEATESIQNEEEISPYGASACDWIGVPLLIGNQVFGAMAIQSYDPSISFEDKDPTILANIAEAIASSLQAKQVRHHLETKVAARTAELEESNKKLEHHIEMMNRLQEQLVESEKQASLGRLVSGVAHELNTPLGISVTANSVIIETTESLVNKINSNSLKRQDAKELTDKLLHSSHLLDSNLNRASKLISRFKQIASPADMSTFETIGLKEHIQTNVDSFKEEHSIAKFSCEVHGDETLTIVTSPKALARVLEILLDNSCRHGFKQTKNYSVVINFEITEEDVLIRYQDNGIGVSHEHADTLFDPFVTSDRARGSIGLGLHVLSNIVHQHLKGTLEWKSQCEQGFNLLIKLPTGTDFIE